MSERQTLPVVPLRGAVVFPGVTVPISVGRASTLRAVEEATKTNQRLFAVAQRENVDKPKGDQLYGMGVIARIVHVQRTPNGLQLLLEGLERANAIEYREGEFMSAVVLNVQDVPPPRVDDPNFAALFRETRERAVELGKRRGVPDAIAARIVEDVKEPGAFADIVAGYLELELADKQELLATTAVEDRLRRVLLHVQRQNAELQAQEKIQTEVQEELGERQREMFLRQQMKAIQKQLGEDKEGNEIDELRERLLSLELPKEAKAEVDRELNRLERSGRESMEGQVIRNYLEWIAELPWSKRSDDNLDIKRAAQVLEDDHHGLEEVKDRVLEFLAVRQLRAKKLSEQAPVVEPVETEPATAIADAPKLAPEKDKKVRKAKAMAKGPILLFVGPPGVGKTSIGKSIARALGREYVRIA
ncbi:MAG TPA: LON peptidase substrate-binding domain-containing protein, partial [Polyangiales bacterium]|nr:LON peptidase substrate-binding domain-containing protein [Polyangiales bacterium]